MKKIILILAAMWMYPAFADSVDFVDRQVNEAQLSQELVNAGQVCIILHTSRRMDSDNRLVLANGKPVNVPRYMRITCDGAGPEFQASVRSIVNAHVPMAEPPQPTREELRHQEIRDVLREEGLIP